MKHGPLLAILAFLAPIAVSFAVYWPRLGDYFVYDDFLFLRAVRNHPFPIVMYRAFTFPTAKPFDEVTLFWRPLADLYFYLARLFGLHPEPYHIANVLTHGIVGGLGIILLWHLTRAPLAAAIAGLLFTVAPTYEFAVTWISQISEFLGAALILAALMSYRLYLLAEKANSRYLAGTVGCTALALLAKESTVILVVLLPALALALPTTERRRSLREVARSMAPVALLGVIFAVVMVVHEYRTGGGTYELGPHIVRNLRDYLKWMVFPYRYGEASGWRTLGAVAFVALGLAAVLLRQRLLGFLFVWTIAALLPFCGFSFGIELRYTYLATLPFAAFAVFCVVTPLRALPPVAARLAALIVGAATVFALVITPLRTRDFQDFLVREARAYETMVTSVRSLCGPLPPESSVLVLGAPYRDLYGMHTPAAVNLYYYHVHAVSVDKLPDLIAFVPNTCIIKYDPQTKGYHRIKAS